MKENIQWEIALHWTFRIADCALTVVSVLLFVRAGIPSFAAFVLAVAPTALLGIQLKADARARRKVMNLLLEMGPT